ncbi:MAG: AIM24 family protein [Candidatus Dormibacteria bacterium]
MAANPPTTYTCPWCGTQSTGTTTSCPACGAPTDIRLRVDSSGWVELPPIKGMTRIQCNNTQLQIHGSMAPVVEANVGQGDALDFLHHVLLWRDDQIQLAQVNPPGGWKRLIGGLPVFLTQAQGPGRLCISRRMPGELIALPIHPGQALESKESTFLLATHSLTYSFVTAPTWFNTRDSDNNLEYHFPIGQFLDIFAAQSELPGLVIMHAIGNGFVRNLQANESILIQPSSFLFKDSSVLLTMHLETAHGAPSPLFTGMTLFPSYLWLRATGPGRIGIQSVTELVESPNLAMLAQHSPMTMHQW